MDASQLATLTVIIAEIALSLHPILIKQIGVNLPTQLLARLGTYSFLGAAFSSPSDRKFSWGSWSTAQKSLLFGLMNLIHIGASYLSYEHLPAGSALALFYTYPFFNILAGVLFLGDTLDTKILPLMAMAFLGVVMIATFTKDGDEKHKDDAEKEGEKKEGFKAPSDKSIPLGIAASLVAAMTETMIFLVAKTGEEPSPFLPVLKLYPGALLGLLAWIGFRKSDLNFKIQNWIPLLLFNCFIGFLGYSLRFFSIPRLPTAIFSILTFIGVASGYSWGLLYAKEVPSLGALAGAGMITGALGILKSL
jgi:drug/metabolite transporter (DMT)-like permease